MLRTYKYRLYPNHTQVEALDFLLWQGRNLYNAALEQRISIYRETGKGISYPGQWAHFRDLRNANPDTLGKLNATSVQQMLRRLDNSFVAFFRRLKTGEKPGFPRFKGRHHFHSLEYHYGDGCKLREGEDGRVLFYVQNAGELKVKYHSDAGLGEFQQLLRYKVEETGGEVIAVNPRNTSQVCSGCGVMVLKSLRMRLHSCPDCGLSLDRDVNAARNILALALPPPGRGGQASTWADPRPCVA